MNLTPYEIRLRFASIEAHAAVDFANAKLIIEMIRQVQNGRYAELAGTFSQLGLAYQTKLGTPPANRDADGGGEPGSSRTGT